MKTRNILVGLVCALAMGVLASAQTADYNIMVYKMDMTWMLGPAGKAVADYNKSMAAFPNIKPGGDFTGYRK